MYRTVSSSGFRGMYLDFDDQSSIMTLLCYILNINIVESFLFVCVCGGGVSMLVASNRIIFKTFFV